MLLNGIHNSHIWVIFLLYWSATGGSELDAALDVDCFAQRNAYVDLKIRNMLGNGNDI